MNLAIQNKANTIIQFLLSEYGLNTPLPNADKLSKILGYSRSVVRETFIYLNAKGFVSYTHGKRTRLIKDPFNTEEHF